MPEYADMMEKASRVHFTGAQAATLQQTLPSIDNDCQYMMLHELVSTELPDESDVASSAALPDDVLDTADSTEHQGGVGQDSAS